ncbi:MAG: hypothetical protein BGO10_00870 [Chlamydia sp. 32-24]|nr:MAG: hypothetical protein BGO10_00870 [Chlamydia sp. 32-24]
MKKKSFLFFYFLILFANKFNADEYQFSLSKKNEIVEIASEKIINKLRLVFENNDKTIVKKISIDPFYQTAPLFHIYRLMQENDQKEQYNQFDEIKNKVRKIHFIDHDAYEYRTKKQWQLVDLDKQAFYLQLDNKTICDHEDILQDPFLAIRTKISNASTPYSEIQSSSNQALFHNRINVERNKEFICKNPTLNLYPDEKITYFLNKENCFLSFELKGDQRKYFPEDLTIETFFPFDSIENIGNEVIFLTEPHLTLLPGEKKEIHGEVIKLNDKDSVKVTCHLPSYYQLANEITNYKCQVSAEEINNLNLHATTEETETLPPAAFCTNFNQHQFTINSSQNFEKIWWQISDNLDFSVVIPNFNIITKPSEKLLLSLIDETFINPSHKYYLRLKTFQNNQWSSWSKPFAFEIEKPESLQNVEFNKENDHFYLSWDRKKDNEETFYIYGSNNKDFLPSLYSNVDYNKISGLQVVQANESNNLIDITTEHKVEIGKNFAYYRVIVEKRGKFSTPSPLVYFYDNDISHERKILQAKDIFTAERQALLQPTSKPQREKSLKGLTHFIKSSLNTPYQEQDIMERIRPYILPDNHPMKDQLDRIFSQCNVLEGRHSIRAAGFDATDPVGCSGAVVACHPKLRGYLVKMYRCDQPFPDEIRHFIKRVNGSRIIRESIDSRSFQNYLTVPKKWIYKLPNYSHCSGIQRYAVLLVEKKNILKSKKNNKKWKSNDLNRDQFRAFYTIMELNGLHDSVYPFNVPFCKDGRIAFIDTEQYHGWPIKWEKFARRLSYNMRIYLNQLQAGIAQ